MIISPSILSADFANLKKDIELVEPYCKWLHVDVMDGHFVPNISIGVPVVKSLRKATNLFLDTHLMIENPEKYIDAFFEAGSDLITVHFEATKDNTKSVLEQIKSKGLKAGLSIKPKTTVEEIKDYIDLFDLILIMTVEPGFGGQSFIEPCARKIWEVKHLAKNKDLIIQVDGGINAKTGALCRCLGANSLVAGSYIFSKDRDEESVKSAIEALE